MLGMLLVAAFVVMLGVLYFKEGWKKALKVAGAWFVTLFILSLAMTLLDKGTSSTHHILSLLLNGSWVIGLFIYNVKEGYIGNI